jgi:hypothetical protein
VTNASFGVDLRAATLSLDGRPLVLSWQPANKTIWALAFDVLPDGDHGVVVSLEDAAGRTVAGSWVFSLDTVVPWVDFDPLPVTAESRVHTVTGTVLEDHLVGLDVNGYVAILNGTTFQVPVLLWPGRNDLLGTATDLAANRGLAASEVRWFPPPAVNVTFEAFVHPNASFLVRFPDTWEVRPDEVLEGDVRADVVAVQPESGTARATIAVVSRAAGSTMTEGFLLSILGDSIRRLEASSTVEVVSAPRLAPSSSGAVAAEFSVVETLFDGSRVFRHVTGLWSRSVGRIWLVLGSTSTSTVEDQWYALEAAGTTFRAIEPPPPPSLEPSPKGAVDLALVVTVAAILFVTLFSAVGIYAWRVRARRVRSR